MKTICIRLKHEIHNRGSELKTYALILISVSWFCRPWCSQSNLALREKTDDLLMIADRHQQNALLRLCKMLIEDTPPHCSFAQSGSQLIQINIARSTI